VRPVNVGGTKRNCHARIRGYCGHGFQAARAGEEAALDEVDGASQGIKVP
jgi:hypothetical protein